MPCSQCGRTGGTEFAAGTDYEYATTDRIFRFIRCIACGLVYLTPRPTSAALPLIYPPHYYAFTGEDAGPRFVRALRARWELGKLRDYVRWLGPGPRKILDVGCGTGRLLALFQRAGRAAEELYGIDLDVTAVETARSRGFHATVATIECYAPAERFDLIVLQQVIEHVDDAKAVLAKLRDLLAPEGVLILETPNLAGWDWALFRRSLWGGYHFPRHWTLFTQHSLRTMVEGVGLDVLEQRCLMSLSFWTWSIHHRLVTWGAPAWLERWSRPPNAAFLTLTLPLEALRLALGLETSNQRLVARRRTEESPGAGHRPEGRSALQLEG